VRVIRSRRLSLVGHVAQVEKGIMHPGLWWGKLKERDHLKDLAIDGSERTRIGVDWINLAQDRDILNTDNKPSGSIRYREFLD
jgi:hypothetical protein